MIDDTVMFYTIAAIIIYVLIRWIRSRPVKPDPWYNISENHQHDDVIDISAKEVKKELADREKVP